MLSNDRDFEAKTADISGLYVKPPQHAAVFCVDEKDCHRSVRPAESGAATVAGCLERHSL